MEELDAMLPRFLGEQQQTPPMYSAIKVDGQKLYDIARRGEEIARTPRNIHIYEIRHTGEYEGDPLLYIHCSKGTYIRTLCHDIGEALGCGASMSSLRRISSGCFSIVDAYRIGEVNCEAAMGDAQELLLPVDSLFEQFPAITADEGQEKRCRVGNSFPAAAEDGRYRLYDRSGEFLALVQVDHGTASTIKSFFEVDEPCREE
jgi:tRNA pseudouridine55 synthase